MLFPPTGIDFQRLFLSSAVLIATFYANKYKNADLLQTFPDPPLDYNLPHVKQYDFIIAGGGSAGCVLANKLSRHFSVLVIEAGGIPVPQTSVPAFQYVLRNATKLPIFHTWTTAKQSNAILYNDGLSIEVQGKVLGGSSVVNGLSYSRGNPKDYDNWAKITGDNSWKYSNIRKYFKMTENFYDAKNSNGELGKRGPLGITVKVDPSLQKAHKLFLAAGKELGFKILENTNNPQKEGIGPTSLMSKFGRRVSGYDAFIKKIAQKRKNLHISLYSFVTKVDIDSNNRAIGVYYTKHGVKYYARAKFEVIMSAGALNSPIILIKSGIGQASDLRALGIPVKADLPVGKHLHEHPDLVYGLCAKLDNSSNLVSSFENIGSEDVSKYLKSGKGPISRPDGIIGVGLVVSSIAKAEGTPDWPDIQLGFELTSPLYNPGVDEYKLCSFVYVGRAKREGSISLHPEMSRSWLKDTKSYFVFLKPQHSNQLESNYPQILILLAFGSDDFLTCLISEMTDTGHHSSGTCRMGAKPGSSVVDSEFRVWGIKAFHLINNSIQPAIVNTNMNAAAYIIGRHSNSISHSSSGASFFDFCNREASRLIRSPFVGSVVR